MLLGARAPTRPRAACRPCMQELAWTGRQHAEGGLTTRRNCGRPRHSLGEQADWTHFLNPKSQRRILLGPYSLSLPQPARVQSVGLRRLVRSSCVRQDLHGASHMKTPADIPLERIAMGAAPGYEPHRDGHWPALRLALRRVKENGGHTEWPVRARASTAPARTSPEGPSSCPTWRPPPHPPRRELRRSRRAAPGAWARRGTAA